MNIKLITLATLALLILGGCGKSIICERGKGAVVTQSLDMPPLEGIDLSISADINLTYGQEQSVSVSGQQNIIDELKLDTKNGIWDISFDKCITNHKDLVIDITLPTLRKIKISGSGDVSTTNNFPDQGDMDIDISGSGDISLDMAAQAINSNISGSGNVTLAGTAEDLSFKISGSGDVWAFDCVGQRVDVKISGSGNVRVNAQESLDIDISGSGDVYYRGNPLINSSSSGSGNVHNAN